jgi:curved DNA-binding protein CbpA
MDLLKLAPGTSPAKIKAAYHHALLAAHPDKNNAAQSAPDIATIKDAYRVLSLPTLCAKAKADQDPLKGPQRRRSSRSRTLPSRPPMRGCMRVGAVARMLLLGLRWAAGCILFRTSAAQRLFGSAISWRRKSMIADITS